MRRLSKEDGGLVRKYVYPEMTEPCPEKRETILEEAEVIAGRQKVPNEEVSVEISQSTGGFMWGTASSRKASRTAEEARPGCWWVPVEVGKIPQRLTRSVFPALRKGCVRREPNKIAGNGVRERSWT